MAVVLGTPGAMRVNPSVGSVKSGPLGYTEAVVRIPFRTPTCPGTWESPVVSVKGQKPRMILTPLCLILTSDEGSIPPINPEYDPFVPPWCG